MDATLPSQALWTSRDGTTTTIAAAAAGTSAWNDSTTAAVDYNYNTLPDTDTTRPLAQLVSDDTLQVFKFVNYVILTTIITTTGIVLNTINIIIFSRMGFHDSVNISLLALAVADLVALIPLLWKALLNNPLLARWDDLPFDLAAVEYYIGGWPHACFGSITNVITIYISFERCLCVAMPLKVKRIITPKRTAIILILIFCVIIASLCPLYFNLRFGQTFVAWRNKTLFGLIYSKKASDIEKDTLSFFSFVSLFAMMCVCIFTTILVIQVKKKSSWREKTSSAGNTNSKSMGRDLKVIKMVMMVCIIFIVCYFPSVVNIIIMILIKEYQTAGRFKNLNQLTWTFFNNFAATNSTINLFVYLKMSSKYAKLFYKMFGCQKDLSGKPVDNAP